jgi:hypothetical protein
MAVTRPPSGSNLRTFSCKLNWSPAPFSPSLSLAELAPLSYRFLNHRGKSETFPLGELVEPSSLAERSETSRRVRELRLRVRSLHPIRYPPRLADSQSLIVHTSQTRYSARKLAWYNSLRLSVPVSFTVGSLKPFKGFSLRRNSRFLVPRPPSHSLSIRTSQTR